MSSGHLITYKPFLKIRLSFCYRFDYRLVDVEDFIFETSHTFLIACSQHPAAHALLCKPFLDDIVPACLSPIIVFWGALSYIFNTVYDDVCFRYLQIHENMRHTTQCPQMAWFSVCAKRTAFRCT